MQYELLCGEYSGWFVQNEAWGRAPFLEKLALRVSPLASNSDIELRKISSMSRVVMKLTLHLPGTFGH